jgi:uncharacterized protein DUF4153
MQQSRVWYLAILAGVLGAAFLFDAIPGVNWLLWVAVVTAGLIVHRRPDRPTLRALALPLGFAILLAAGAAVTTTPLLVFGIFVMTASLLALALLLARDPAEARDYGALEIITAPIRASGNTLKGIASALVTTVESVETLRERPALRGALIAAPIVLVFALLFASADPLLARGRDAVLDALTSWDSLPRFIFGALLTLFVLGAYTASLESGERKPSGLIPATGRMGMTEWRIVIGAVATMSWLFVLLQLSYLFRIAPSAAGSGVTYAEYARRGFGELAVAATVAALLIVAAHRHTPARSDALAGRRVVVPSLALLAAVACILMSAFHRVSLYEGAYGYTTARVYAQAYMILVLAILATLAWRTTHTFDVRALAREVMTLSLLAFAAIIYWNGDAWVARANLDRFARTGKLDIPFVTRGLSPDAYPTLVGALASMREPERATLEAALARRVAGETYFRVEPHWYEWNFRRARARAALATIPAVLSKSATL